MTQSNEKPLDELLLEVACFWMKSSAVALVDQGASAEEMLAHLRGPVLEEVNAWLQDQRKMIEKSELRERVRYELVKQVND